MDMFEPRPGSTTIKERLLDVRDVFEATALTVYLTSVFDANVFDVVVAPRVNHATVVLVARGVAVALPLSTLEMTTPVACDDIAPMVT